MYVQVPLTLRNSKALLHFFEEVKTAQTACGYIFKRKLGNVILIALH